jgi:hypothetical protein
VTEDQVLEIMATLRDAYPQRQLELGTLNVYAEHLIDLDFAAARAAVSEILTESRFFPTIAEIRQKVFERRCGLPSAEEAWEEVMRGIRDVGSYGMPRWSTPELARTVDAVGWLNICLSETPGVERGHFLRIYEALRERSLHEANSGSLRIGAGERRQVPRPHLKTIDTGSAPESA